MANPVRPRPNQSLASPVRPGMPINRAAGPGARQPHPARPGRPTRPAANTSAAVATPTAPGTHSASHHASQFSARQRTIALVVVALAFVMDLLDSTIVNIAIPSIQANLHASYSAIQWLIAGYMLSFATLLISGGRMGDVFGYRRLFMIGVGGFTLASLLSGLAGTPEMLIGARLLQGAMAALMVPQVMSLMQVMYDKDERGGVMGLFGALGGIAATLGPIVGGLLIQWNVAGLDWRPIFLINVPVGLFALVAGWKVLPAGKSEHPLHLDWVGTGLIVVALVLLIYPLIQGRDLDWPWWTFAMMAAALPILALFAWFEHRKDQRDGSALVVPGLFRLRSFVTGLTVNVAFEMLFIGFFLINTLMLQAGLGFSVIKAALTGIGFAVGIGASIGGIGPKLLKTIGRNTIFLGIVLMTAGYSAMAYVVNQFGFDVQPWLISLTLLSAGLGAGFIMSPIFSVVLSDVDVAHAGSASGVMNALQQVGGAVGVAVIGVLFFGIINQHAATSAQNVTTQLQSDLAAAGLPSSAQAPLTDQFTACFVDRSHEKDTSEVPDSCKTKPLPMPPLPAADDSLGVAQLAKLTPAQREAYHNQQMAAIAQIEAAAKLTTAKVGAAMADNGKTANEQNFAYAFTWSVVYEVGLLAVLALLSLLLPRKIRSDGQLAH